MSGPRFFLDTHEWNHLLLGHPSLSVGQAEALRQHLIAKAQRDRPVALGSPSLLQELLPLQRSNPDLYTRLVRLLFAVVGQNWLRPLNELHVAEATHGGRLGGRAPFLPIGTRRRMRELTESPADVLAVVQDTQRGIDDFVVGQARAQAEVTGRLAEANDGDPVALLPLLREWWNNLDIADWVKDIAASGVDRGLVAGDSVSTVSSATVPSAWHFTSFKLARIRMNIGEGERVQPSDYADAEHYAAAVYADVLVTEDRKFTASADLLVPDRPFSIETFQEFAARFA